MNAIAPCIKEAENEHFGTMSQSEQATWIDEIALRNVQRTVDETTRRSSLIRKAVSEEKLLVVGALYDVQSGKIDFLDDLADANRPE